MVRKRGDLAVALALFAMFVFSFTFLTQSMDSQLTGAVVESGSFEDSSGDVSENISSEPYWETAYVTNTSTVIVYS